MEATLYAFTTALFVILVWVIAFVVLLFKKCWKTIVTYIALGVIGGVAGYLLPSDGSNIMVARFLNMDVMMEVSIAEIHMIIGIAVGLLFGVFSIVAKSMRRRHASQHDMR